MYHVYFAVTKDWFLVEWVTYSYYTMHNDIRTCVLCMCLVPAVHKDPDIQIFDDKNQAVELIKRDIFYNGTWDTEILGNDDFNETDPSKIKFSIEDWLFQNLQNANVFGWIRRKDFSRLKNQFFVKNNQTKGFFSFKHSANVFAEIQFGLSVVAVRKQTKNLEIIYPSTFLSFLPISGENAFRKYCQMWTTGTKEVIKTDKLKNCPCTLESAKINSNLKTDFTCSSTETDCHENVNAFRCFLMNITDSEMYVLSVKHAYSMYVYQYIYMQLNPSSRLSHEWL